MDSRADELEQIVARFNDPADPLKIIIVTAKLLTGFDAPILYCAVPRQAAQGAHAPAGDHPHQPGLPAEQDPRADRRLPRRLRRRRQGVEAFDEKSRPAGHHQHRGTQEPARAGHRRGAGLLPWRRPNRRRLRGPRSRPRRRSPTTQQKDAFGLAYSVVSQLWEAISPDPMLAPVSRRLPLAHRRLRVGPPSDITGRLVWHALGAKTLDLINEHVQVEVPQQRPGDDRARRPDRSRIS